MDNRLILLNGKISDIARLRSMKGNIFEGKLSEYHYKEYLLANRLIAILKGMGLLQPGDILARYISAYPEMAPEIWDAVNMLKSYNEGILLKRKTLCYIILQETRGTICSNACFIILLHREGLVTEANLVKAGKIYSWWARFHYTFLDGLTFQNSQNELIKLVTFSDVIKYDNGNHSIDYIIDLCYQLLKKKIHDRIYYIMLLANPEHALYLQYAILALNELGLLAELRPYLLLYPHHAKFIPLAVILFKQGNIVTINNFAAVLTHSNPAELFYLLDLIIYNRCEADERGLNAYQDFLTISHRGHSHHIKNCIPLTQSAFDFCVAKQIENSHQLYDIGKTLYCSRYIMAQVLNDAKDKNNKIADILQALFDENLYLGNLVYLQLYNNKHIDFTNVIAILDKRPCYIKAILIRLLQYCLDHNKQVDSTYYLCPHSSGEKINMDEFNMVVADTVTSMSRISVVAFMMLFKRKTPPLDRLSKDTAIKICREIDDEKTISRLHYISGSQTLSP